MNNILKIALTLAVGIVLAGCYNDFDNPALGKGLHGQGLHGDGRRDHFDQGPESEILREMGP